MNDHSLLDAIERDVVDDGTPLASALRKCVVLGGRAGSAALRDWATRELRGYAGGDELPSYRQIAAPILIDAVTTAVRVTGQRISPNQLPEVVRKHVQEEVELRIGVGEIEALILHTEASSHEAVRLSLPGGADIARMMNYEIGERYQQIISAYWSVSTASLRGVVDQVRTTLAELVAELRAGMPADQELPSPDVANQAVNVAVHGSGARVTVTTAQAKGDHYEMGDVGRSGMSVFDQRGQHVRYQYNAHGDINFGQVQDRAQLAQELDRLRKELAEAARQRAIDADSEADASYQLQKAALQARQSEPDKQSVLGYLQKAKGLVEGVNAAAGIASGIGEAIACVQDLF
jgi:nucleotidyltransferase/DNA polymerase involved in DNA repair